METEPDELLPPQRGGPPPGTTTGIPHLQLDQWAPRPIQDELWTRMASLERVQAGSSDIGPMSARGLYLSSENAGGPADAFISGWEFAHLHGDGSGSLHLTLPPAVAVRAIAAGWAIPHPFAGESFLPSTTVMVFGPRDERELDIVWGLVRHSYLFARGLTR
jgi:Family of unknown function (DUF5519)